MTPPSGHEPAFRRLFAEEAETRLRRLAAEVPRLDQTGGADGELVASLFRDAHSIKGAASMVGLEHVARLAHVMEEVLDDVRAGTRTVTPEVVDALLAAADALRALLPGIGAGGDDHGPDAAEALAGPEARLRAVRAAGGEAAGGEAAGGEAAGGEAAGGEAPDGEAAGREAPDGDRPGSDGGGAARGGGG